MVQIHPNIDLTALVDWSKAISWRSELTLAGINTAKQYPDWPARLGGKITTRGSLYGGSWQLSGPFNIQMVASQRQLNARHRPLVVAVTGQGAISGHGVLFHIAFQL